MSLIDTSYLCIVLGPYFMIVMLKKNLALHKISDRASTCMKIVMNKKI